MKYIIDITGPNTIEDKFKVTANKSRRHFTIWKNSSKYRTLKFSKDEFEEMEYNTAEDWKHYLRTECSYYLIKL